jgi:hypothetical protein
MKKDPICKLCAGKSRCDWTCPAIQWINGKTPRKEALLHDMKDIDTYHYENSNAKIAELIADHLFSFENAVFITNYKVRLIALGILGEIPKNEIANILKLNYRQINRLISGK